jgi:hypothetical protein
MCKKEYQYNHDNDDLNLKELFIIWPKIQQNALASIIQKCGLACF